MIHASRAITPSSSASGCATASAICRATTGRSSTVKRVDKEQFIAEGNVIQIAGTKFQFAEDGLEQMDTHGGLRLDAIRLNKVLPGGKNLLQDISFSIYPREFVALVGTSGAGKSTLLDALNGFRPATHGQVLINGTNLYSHFDAYRTELGYVPQDDIMHRELTVYEALDYAAKLRMPADTSAAGTLQRGSMRSCASWTWTSARICRSTS